MPSPQELETSASRALETRIRVARILARELPRGALAFFLAAIFGLTIYWACANVGSNWEHAKQLLDVLIPVEAALLGSAVAFFFSRP